MEETVRLSADYLSSFIIGMDFLKGFMKRQKYCNEVQTIFTISGDIFNRFSLIEPPASIER